MIICQFYNFRNVFCYLKDMRLKIYKSIKRFSYALIVALMLGVSNVILEETRMVNDTRETIEQQEIIPDTDLEKEDIFEL